MRVHIKEGKKGKIMYRVLSLFMVTLLLSTHAFGNQQTYQAGHYRVRQTGDTCKLEIFLESKSLVRSNSGFWRHGFNDETIGFFSVFQTDEYFGELITEKARVGLVDSGFSVEFDGKTDESVVASDSTGSDNLWRWRHFAYHHKILRKIKRSRFMEVRFSNGTDRFHFKIPLKGSSKAVRALTACQGR